MNDWIESEKQCVSNGVITAKTKFTIYTNFSVFEHSVQQLLSEGESVSIAQASCPPIHLTPDNLKIGKLYEITEIILSENKFEPGLFEIEVIFSIPEQNAASKEVLSSTLSSGSKLIRDYFRSTATFLGFSFISSGSLWTYALVAEEWKQVSQMGTSRSLPVSMSECAIQQVLPELNSTIQKVETCLGNKKLASILDILNGAFRMLRNQLFRDAFINFYKVVEIVFKDKDFRKHLFETTGKPKEYINVTSSCNQKFQMLFLWEYISELKLNKFKKYKPKSFLDLAEIRNELAHKGDVAIPSESTRLVNELALFLLNKYCEMK